MQNTENTMNPEKRVIAPFFKNSPISEFWSVKFYVSVTYALFFKSIFFPYYVPPANTYQQWAPNDVEGFFPLVGQPQ